MQNFTTTKTVLVTATAICALLLAAPVNAGPRDIQLAQASTTTQAPSAPPGVQPSTPESTSGHDQVLTPAASSPAIASAPPTAGMSHSKSAANPEDRVEARIKQLHAQLHITPAQESQWNQVAQVMRDNAASIGGLIRQRQQNAKQFTAVDDLKNYEAIADAHDKGLEKLVPAFETLYASLSDAQKKSADRLFRGAPHHSESMAKKGT